VVIIIAGMLRKFDAFTDPKRECDDPRESPIEQEKRRKLWFDLNATAAEYKVSGSARV